MSEIYTYCGHKGSVWQHDNFDFLIISKGKPCKSVSDIEKCKMCPKLHYKVMVIRPSENNQFKLFEIINKCCAKSTFICKKLK